MAWHVGKTVHLIRLIRDMSQSDLAQASDLSTKTISRFENGGAYDSHTIAAIAAGLKVDARQLVAFHIDAATGGQTDSAVAVIGAPDTTGRRSEADMLKELLWHVFQSLTTEQQYLFLQQMIEAGKETPPREE